MTLGIGWRLVSPAGLTADQTRHVLTTVVYYVFLPALILDVLYSADIGIHSLEISLIGVSSILLTILIIWMITSIFKFSRPQTGAIILAASFPNCHLSWLTCS
jgi:predicted permease